MANVFRQFLLDVEHGDVNSVQRSIENGIDLETRDEDEQTALILAARCNHLELVRILLEAKANVNANDVDHWTALLNASHNGNFDMVKILVENDAQLEHFDCGQFTSLIWASYQGFTSIVKYLISVGANVDAIDEHGISSLGWASGRNHFDIVEALLEAGASPNLCDKNNTTPLIWASRRGSTKIVDLLLKFNANINAIGMKKMTALIAATKEGHEETAMRLLESRIIDLKIQDKDGETALSYACAQGLTNVVAELVRRHAYVNTVNKTGDPVLFSAVKGGQEECLTLLLENHADINAIGSENKTAIWWAVEQGRLNVVKYLLQYQPDIEVAGGSDHDTPLLLATKRKRVGIVYELIKHDAKLSSVDRFGDNSLHIALRNRSRDIADILLSNPRHAKYLYRPNKCGETPYKIDSNLQKSILTTIFGQRTLNINDDSILGYDLYSSALAEILSEPSLQTPITVGLYAKWGSGKSALLTHLKDEMRSFAQLTDFPTMKFSPLLCSVIILLALFSGFFTGFVLHFIIGISIGVAFLILSFSSILILQYFLKNKDYLWTATVAQFIQKRLDILRFLLQVLFMNPYARLKSENSDCKHLKFIFTEYGKVSTVEGEKASATMIADLAMNLEESFGLVATRLCRAFHSKNLDRHRFRHICCVPSFVFVLIQISLLISILILIWIHKFPSFNRSMNTTIIVLCSILGLSLILGFRTCLRLTIGLIKSPKSKIFKLAENASRRNESSLYHLRKEVSQLSYIIKTIEAFLHINTRLVVLIDGLDVCEQQRIVQILDQVHVLLTKENDPFVTLIVCDPHKMMQDINGTSNNSPQQTMFDTNVNGHEYLRSIIQLPIYLQLNLSKTKKNPTATEQLTRRRRNTLSNGTSTLDVSAKTPQAPNRLSKNRRRRQRRDTLPNTKPVTTSELMLQLIQSDYFLDINPRILQRLINVIAMTGRILRANQLLFSWKRLGCWSYLVEQWPYRISWIVVYYEDHENDVSEETTLKIIYEKIKNFVNVSNDILLELDRSGRKFELCLEQGEPVLNLADLKLFLPSTCNLDPYLNKIIRDSPSYYFFTHPEENELLDNFNSTRFHSHPEMTNCPAHGTFPSATTTHRKRPIYSRLIRPIAAASPSDQNRDERSNATDVKLNLSLPLSQMTVKDICDCLKNDFVGLKTLMIPMYIEEIQENNINGLVLSSCDLDELKQILSMAFGDWVLFSNWIRTKRDEERRTRFSMDSNLQETLGEILSKQSEQTREDFDESPLVVFPTSKNVKFVIPFNRSGFTSNDSTLGVDERRNRQIRRVEDIFPSITTNGNVTSSSSVENDNEQIPLLNDK